MGPGDDISKQLEEIQAKLQLFAKQVEIGSVVVDKEKIKSLEKELELWEKKRNAAVESNELVGGELKNTEELVKTNKRLLQQLRDSATATGQIYNSVAAAGNTFSKFLKDTSLQLALSMKMAEEYKKIEAANGDLVNSANQLIAVIEKYPDLKTANSFVRLQDQLVGTERRIKFSRNDFNKAIQGYNTSVRSFPSSLVASIFSFKVKDGFKADIGSEKAPEITFTK